MTEKPIINIMKTTYHTVEVHGTKQVSIHQHPQFAVMVMAWGWNQESQTFAEPNKAHIKDYTVSHNQTASVAVVTA